MYDVGKCKSENFIIRDIIRIFAMLIDDADACP